MLIVLSGPDDYRREEKKREILAELSRKHSGLGIRRFDMAEDGAAAMLEEFVRSESLFWPRKAAVLESVFESKAEDLPAKLRAFGAKPNAVIIISEREKPTGTFLFLAKSSGGNKKDLLAQSFEYLEGADWVRLVRNLAERQGIELDEKGLAFICAAYAGDTWRLATELEKISSLGRRRIGRDNLERLGVELTPEFWDLITALKSGDLARRLRALETIFAEGEPAGKVFNILAYQFAERFDQFALYDRAVKGGKLDYEEVLVDFAIK